LWVGTGKGWRKTKNGRGGKTGGKEVNEMGGGEANLLTKGKNTYLDKKTQRVKTRECMLGVVERRETKGGKKLSQL